MDGECLKEGAFNLYPPILCYDMKYIHFMVMQLENVEHFIMSLIYFKHGFNSFILFIRMCLDLTHLYH